MRKRKIPRDYNAELFCAKIKNLCQSCGDKCKELCAKMGNCNIVEDRNNVATPKEGKVKRIA